MKDLGALGKDVVGDPAGINNQTQVVGGSCDSTGFCRAFFWDNDVNDVVMDLNSLAPNSPLYLFYALGINDAGEIVGLGMTSSGDFHTFLATPSYEAAGNSGDPDTQGAKHPAVLPEEVRERCFNRECALADSEVGPSLRGDWPGGGASAMPGAPAALPVTGCRVQAGCLGFVGKRWRQRSAPLRDRVECELWVDAWPQLTNPRPMTPRPMILAGCLEACYTRATMNPNKALWEKGDFTEIAALMRESGEAVVKSLEIKPPLRVLDLGCGDGTTAVPLGRSGAEVVGIDIASNLVEAGNKRAAEAGLNNLKFQEGDASNLEGVADDSFDLTLSVFGAMFAPRPFDVAREMVRVTKPGGRIVMGNWIPNDPTFVAQLLKISSAFTPPPPEGFVSPMTWGVDTHIIERFGQAGVPKEKISMVKDTFHFRSTSKSPEEVMESFRRFYGPTMNAYDAAEKNGKVEEIHSQLAELAKGQNKQKQQWGTL